MQHVCPGSTSLRRRLGRRGLTLIETSVVLTLNATLTGLAVGALLAMQRVDRTASAQSARHGELIRLTDQLRRDVHACRRAVFDAPNGSLRLETDDGSVTHYAAEANRWRRQTLREAGRSAEDPSGVASSAGSPRTTLFRVPRNLILEADPSDARVGELLWLRFSQSEIESFDKGAGESFEIFTVVGRNTRIISE